MESHRHLMLAPDSALRSDMVTDHGMAILAEGGVPALTPQTVGDRLGCTRQAVHQWFGGQQPLRHVVATAFCVRWGRWVRARVHSAGLAGLLPDTDEAVGWCRVWLALVEHAPRDVRIADLVEGVRRQEREEIAHLLATGSAWGCPRPSRRSPRNAPRASSRPPRPPPASLLDVKQRE